MGPTVIKYQWSRAHATTYPQHSIGNQDEDYLEIKHFCQRRWFVDNRENSRILNKQKVSLSWHRWFISLYWWHIKAGSEFRHSLIVLQTACLARGSEPKRSETCRLLIIFRFAEKLKPPVLRVVVYFWFYGTMTNSKMQSAEEENGFFWYYQKMLPHWYCFDTRPIVKLWLYYRRQLLKKPFFFAALYLLLLLLTFM